MPAYRFGYTTPNHNFTKLIPVIKLKYDNSAYDDYNLLDETEKHTNAILEKKKPGTVHYMVDDIFGVFDVIVYVDDDNSIFKVSVDEDEFEVSRFNNNEELLLHKTIYHKLESRMKSDFDYWSTSFWESAQYFCVNLENRIFTLINVDCSHEDFDEIKLLLEKIDKAGLYITTDKEQLELFLARLLMIPRTEDTSWVEED
jgi:hypothetical protein